MAKKDKSEKNAKSTKDKEESAKKGESSNKSCSIFKCLLISSSVSTLLVSLAVYQFYSAVTHVPPMPRIDLNENWGSSNAVAKDTSIRPFRLMFSTALREEMRTLFELYRRNNYIPGLDKAGWSYGVNSSDFASLTTEWIFKYGFRERAKVLNKFNHFKTNVQGLDLHFIHVKPNLENKNVKVYPLLLLHGFPGSVREFYEAIPKLTTVKKEHDFVFEVIVPSLPGFIYSEGATRPGMSLVEVAVIMRNLMHRIGITQYYVQGGDIGHIVGSHMATIFPNEVLGFHSNFPANFAKPANWLWALGSLCPSVVAKGVENKTYPVTDKLKFYMEESGYLHLQSTKPDTIGIALEDSPAGLAAYIVDRFMMFTDPKNKKRPRGGLNRYYSHDKILDNVMLYWTSKSITTSMRLFKESFVKGELQQTLAQIPTPVPTWVLRLKHDVVQHSDFLLSLKYPNLVGSTTLDSGGHFAAFEKPTAFAVDIFKAVDNFVKFRKQI